MLSLDQLRKIMPQAPAGAFIVPLQQTLTKFAIADGKEVAAFLATLSHESAQLTKLEENLNYSADALHKVWPQRFPPAVAAAYARQPERIANRAYADREGNGGEASGDGWRNRGAGGIQLTFENNHAAVGAYFDIERAKVAAWLRTPAGACLSAGWFWTVNHIAPLARAGDFDGVCDVVNRGKKTAAIGDSIGWAERLNAYYTTLRGLA